jgi:hypothetical protein
VIERESYLGEVLDESSVVDAEAKEALQLFLVCGFRELGNSSNGAVRGPDTEVANRMP